MAEPAYPTLDTEEERKPIGFEALVEEPQRQRVDDKGISKKKDNEEIGLIPLQKVT